MSRLLSPEVRDALQAEEAYWLKIQRMADERLAEVGNLLAADRAELAKLAGQLAAKATEDIPAPILTPTNPNATGQFRPVY